MLVTNSGDATATDLRLSPAPAGSSGADPTVTPDTSTSLAAGGSLAYELSVPAWTRAAPPTELTLLAEYRANGVDQATATAVELLAPSPLDPDKIAAVELKASLATLKSGDAEPVYLLVHNKSARALTVERIVASGPSFIDFEDLPRNVEVEPGQVAVLEVDAAAESQVTPGEQQLLFRLETQSGKASFDLVASQTVKVAVAGESEVLTALGVPSLLLLPGFLALATAAILWRIRFRRREWDGQAFPFPLKEPEFWVLAVVISIAIVSAAAGLGTDLLGRYGLEDLICIWIASMLIGAVGYVGAVSLYNRWREARSVSSEDGPIEVLKKLGKQGLSLERPRFDYGAAEQSSHLFLLQAPNDSRAATWASPQISFTWRGDGDVGLEEQIGAQLTDGQDPATLAELLARGEAAKQLTTAFAPNPGGVDAPVLVPKEKIAPTRSTVMVGEE